MLFGQDDAEAAFLAAAAAGRLPHAWLLTGPRGVGKATLAWRIARHLIAGRHATGQPRDGPRPSGLPPARGPRLAAALPLPPPAGRQGRAPADRDHRRRGPRAQELLPALRRRRWPPRRHRRRRRRAERRRRQRAPEDPRGAARPRGAPPRLPPPGRAAADAALALPRAAPAPARRPSRSPPRSPLPAPPPVPPTPRRSPPSPAARSPPRTAWSPATASPSTPRSSSSSPPLPGSTAAGAIALAEAAAGRDAALRYALTLDLVRLALGRLARAAAGGDVAPVSPAEAALLDRLGATPAQGRLWADLLPELAGRAAHARAVNLDPAQVILDTFLQIDAAAAEARAHAA